MRGFAVALSAFAPAFGLAQPIQSSPGTSILLDNRCPAEEWESATRRDLGDGVELLLQHDARHAHLCFRVPAGSFATMDLYLQSADGSAPWNLHASAQLGEKRRGGEGWPPEWNWGNQHDWYSPAVPFRGVRQTEAGPRADFGAVEAREIQLSRQRFGAGPWRAMVELRALGPQLDRELTFPAKANSDDPATWQALDFDEE